MRAFTLLLLTLPAWSPMCHAAEILLNERSPAASIVSSEGLGTARASLTAKVTQASAHGYCRFDPYRETTANGGLLTFEQCLSKAVADHPGQLSAVADCPGKLLRDTYGRRLKLFGRGEFGNNWIDLSNNEPIGHCVQCNNDAADSQFEALCPFD